MLAVASADLERSKVLLDDAWAEGLTPEQREQSSRALDLDAPEWSCPACGHAFERGPNRCPSCGLRFG